MLRLFAAALVAAGCSSNIQEPAPDMLLADFAMNHDFAGQVGQPCNAFTQQTCDPGLHCVIATLPDGTGLDVCTPNTPTSIAEGERCAPFAFSGYVSDFCEVGTTCVRASAVQGYRCRKLCFRHEECPAGMFCAGATASPTTVTDPVFGGDLPLSACIPSDDCDPVAQTGCPAGDFCYFGPFDDAGRILVCSDHAGGVPAGGDCDHQTACLPGEECSGLGFCRALCYIQGAQGLDGGTPLGACDPGVACNAFFGSAGIYGICE